MRVIDKEIRKSQNGMQTVVYSGYNCQLKFFSFEDSSVPHGRLKHMIEKEYAPIALISKDKSKWVMDMTMPRLAIQPDRWPRVKNATENMLAFWEEIKDILP